MTILNGVIKWRYVAISTGVIGNSDTIWRYDIGQNDRGRRMPFCCVTCVEFTTTKRLRPTFSSSVDVAPAHAAAAGCPAHDWVIGYRPSHCSPRALWRPAPVRYDRRRISVHMLP